MSRNAKVSVIIPTYNRQDIILLSIESVLNQSLQPYEVIVVDDGSTDETYNVIRAIGDPRIRYIYQENSGAGSARNTGIRVAKGDWIAFLDSDDIWRSDKLLKQIDLVIQNPKIDFVHSNRKQKWADGKEATRNTDSNQQKFVQKEFLLRHWVINLSTVMINRRLLSQLSYWFADDLETCEDYELWWRCIILSEQIGYVKEPLATVFISDQSLSRKGEFHLFRYHNIRAMEKVIWWIKSEYRGVDEDKYITILRERQRWEFRDIFLMRMSEVQAASLIRDIAMCTRMLSFSKAIRICLSVAKEILARNMLIH